MNRRTALKVLGTTSVAATVSLEQAVLPQATSAQPAAGVTELPQATSSPPAAGVTAGTAHAPKFFTAHEWETVRTLADIVIPADARSGSATQAGVPEFMDFIMVDMPARQVPMRGGLAWLDTECGRRFGGKAFIECTDAERKAVLDDIAWPARAKREHAHGAAWFSSFRDLVASGFWSSEMGVKDLEFKGNVFNPSWDGCPPEVLRKLGIGG